MRKASDLSLPPVARLSNDEKQAGRNVLMHVRSASIVGMLERECDKTGREDAAGSQLN